MFVYVSARGDKRVFFCTKTSYCHRLVCGCEAGLMLRPLNFIKTSKDLNCVEDHCERREILTLDWVHVMVSYHGAIRSCGSSSGNRGYVKCLQSTLGDKGRHSGRTRHGSGVSVCVWGGVT